MPVRCSVLIEHRTGLWSGRRDLNPRSQLWQSCVIGQASLRPRAHPHRLPGVGGGSNAARQPSLPPGAWLEPHSLSRERPEPAVDGPRVPDLPRVAASLAPAVAGWSADACGGAWNGRPGSNRHLTGGSRVPCQLGYVRMAAWGVTPFGVRSRRPVPVRALRPVRSAGTAPCREEVCGEGGTGRVARRAGASCRAGSRTFGGPAGPLAGWTFPLLRGGTGWDRTSALPLFRRTLYQLSHSPEGAAPRGGLGPPRWSTPLRPTFRSIRDPGGLLGRPLAGAAVQPSTPRSHRGPTGGRLAAR